jgi:hypothetical protein
MFFMGAGVAAADLHARSALRIQFTNFVSDGLGEQSGSSLLFVSQYTRLSSYVCCCCCSSSSFGTVMTMLMISAFHPRPSNLHPPLLHVRASNPTTPTNQTPIYALPKHNFVMI